MSNNYWDDEDDDLDTEQFAGDGSEACVVCQNDDRFTMTLPAFEKIIDDVMANSKSS